MKHGRWCWVSCAVTRVSREGVETRWVYLHQNKPWIEDGVFVSASGCVKVTTAENLRRFTGLALKPGECKRVRFHVEEQGDA